MYPWSAAIKRAHNVMLKQRDMYPSPSSCTDVALKNSNFGNRTVRPYKEFNHLFSRFKYSYHLV